MQKENKGSIDLTRGSIPGGILAFAIPLFLGQLLQQLYNMVDAWVIGNFADNDAFAAVSSTGTVVFLIIGFFSGIATGGGVVISRYFGARDEDNVSKAVHTNFLMGLIASAIGTVAGLILAPHLLVWLGTPDSVMPHALRYLQIYFGGVSTVILYNICMSIMRALGDSIHPLYYLLFSSIVNIGLDLLFVAHPAFHWGVTGAAAATVISQGLSVILCLFRMCRIKDYTRLDFKKLHYHSHMMKKVLYQGLPAGIQNAVITVGNLVIQKNINSFGAYAMSGMGAYSKIEGFVFLPIMSMAMALPTFVSQNLGARQYHRAKKGAVFYSICTEDFRQYTGSRCLRHYSCPHCQPVFLPAGLFPLLCRCDERLRLCCCANGWNVAFLVRPAYRLRHHSTPILPGLSDDFLGLSADMGMQYHPVSDLPVQSRLAASFGLNVYAIIDLIDSLH